MILLVGPAGGRREQGAVSLHDYDREHLRPRVPPFECDPDTLSPFGFSCPAINTLGVVAVRAETNGNSEVSAVQKLVTVNGAPTKLIAGQREARELADPL